MQPSSSEADIHRCQIGSGQSSTVNLAEISQECVFSACQTEAQIAFPHASLQGLILSQHVGRSKVTQQLLCVMRQQMPDITGQKLHASSCKMHCKVEKNNTPCLQLCFCDSEGTCQLACTGFEATSLLQHCLGVPDVSIASNCLQIALCQQKDPRQFRLPNILVMSLALHQQSLAECAAAQYLHNI